MASECTLACEYTLCVLNVSCVLVEIELLHDRWVDKIWSINEQLFVQSLISKEVMPSLEKKTDC